MLLLLLCSVTRVKEVQAEAEAEAELEYVAYSAEDCRLENTEVSLQVEEVEKEILQRVKKEVKKGLEDLLTQKPLRDYLEIPATGFLRDRAELSYKGITYRVKETQGLAAWKEGLKGKIEEQLRVGGHELGKYVLYLSEEIPGTEEVDWQVRLQKKVTPFDRLQLVERGAHQGVLLSEEYTQELRGYIGERKGYSPIEIKGLKGSVSTRVPLGYIRKVADESVSAYTLKAHLLYDVQENKYYKRGVEVPEAETGMQISQMYYKAVEEGVVGVQRYYLECFYWGASNWPLNTGRRLDILQVREEGGESYQEDGMWLSGEGTKAPFLLYATEAGLPLREIGKWIYEKDGCGMLNKAQLQQIKQEYQQRLREEPATAESLMYKERTSTPKLVVLGVIILLGLILLLVRVKKKKKAEEIIG